MSSSRSLKETEEKRKENGRTRQLTKVFDRRVAIRSRLRFSISRLNYPVSCIDAIVNIRRKLYLH